MSQRLCGALAFGAALLIVAIPAFAVGYHTTGTVTLDTGEIIAIPPGGMNFHVRGKDWYWDPYDPINDPTGMGNYINNGPPQSTFNFNPGGTSGGGAYQGSGACGNPSSGSYHR